MLNIPFLFSLFWEGGRSIYGGLVGYNPKGITKKVPLIGVSGEALLNLGGCSFFGI